MHKYDHSKQLAAAALCALAVFGGQAAQAQATLVTAPSQLGNTTLTQQYGYDPNNPLVGPSFKAATVDGNNTLTFTAMNPQQGVGFQGFQVKPTDAAPQFTTAPFGMLNDIAENTSSPSGSLAGTTPTGPLLIQFATPVSGFGLLAQDYYSDQETFTLNVFSDANATIPLNIMPLTSATVDNSIGLGQAVFIGAQLNGLPLIRSATISSVSNASGSIIGSNDFAFGRTFVSAPVPEASTVVGFGMGVLLFAGLALSARKRKAKGTSQDVSQTVG